MASPAAVLSVLVKADGIVKVNKQLGGLQDASEKTSKSADKMSKRHTSAFNSISKRAAAMGGATVAAYAAVAATKDAVAATEDLAKTTLQLSKNFGLTTKVASEWAAVAKTRGIDGKQLTMGFKGLSTAIRGASTGSKAQIKAFDELGISQQTLKAHGNDLNFMLARVSDGLSKLPAGTNRSAIQAKLFGRTWQTLAPLLRDGSGALNEQLGAADKLGATFSGKTAKGMEDMIKKQREAKLATLGLQVAFGTQLAPVLTSVIEKVVALIGYFREHKTIAKVLGIGIVALTVAVTTYNVAAKVAKVATAGWTAAQWLLNVALDANPIALVIIAIGALVAALIIAYKHSETFRKIVNSMWATLKAVAAWMVTAGVNAFHAVANAARAAWGTVRTVTMTVWNGLKAFLTGVWGALRALITAYFNGYRTVIVGVWHAIRTATGVIWDGIKSAILTPIRAVRDLLGGKGGIWSQMRDAASSAWEKIKTGAANFAGSLKDTISKAFEGGVNAVIDFVNAIIRVVNKIPGIPKINKIGHIGGGGGGKGSGGPNGNGRLARGGMVGAMVPGSGSGDKVPLHLGGRLAAMVEPGELVSVANRNATAALMGVNSAVPRFAGGGTLTVPEMADVWGAAGGDLSKADTMGVIGFAESRGNPNARNPSGASGLWQILGQVVAGNLFNPRINALNAIKKSSNGRNLHPWDASRSVWEPLLGKQVGLGLNPLDLIGKLPGVGGLPDWLKGTGKYVLDKVGAWIKDNVVKAVTGGGGPISSGPNGVGTFEGVPMANWVIGSLKYGRQHGAFGNPTSGYRPGFDPHTLTGASEHQGTRYPHGAVDFGGYHDARALAEKLSYVHATAGYKYPLLAPKGFVDDGHASGTGHMRGGVLPFLGSYHNGGIARREGLAHVAAGERMTPAGRAGPLVNIEHAEFKQGIDVNSFAAHIGFKIATA